MLAHRDLVRIASPRASDPGPNAQGNQSNHSYSNPQQRNMQQVGAVGQTDDQDQEPENGQSERQCLHLRLLLQVVWPDRGTVGVPDPERLAGHGQLGGHDAVSGRVGAGDLDPVVGG